VGVPLRVSAASASRNICV